MDFLAQVNDAGNLAWILQMAKAQFPDVKFLDLMRGGRDRCVGNVAAVKRVMARRW